MSHLMKRLHLQLPRNFAVMMSTPRFQQCRRLQHEDHQIPNYDLAVVGGGIVGVASAREIQLRHPHLQIALLEKESDLAVHQSGNNSGVIHAGIYYKPGSMKARLCVQGLHLTYKYLDDHDIPYKKCGKLIVATKISEMGRLMELYKRGARNKVPDIKLICGNHIKSIEPHCRGVAAIHSPHTGIVDWKMVTQYYACDFMHAGGSILLDFKVAKFFESNCCDYPIGIADKNRHRMVRTRYVITCGGLQSDLLAELTGCSRAPRIVPFRGEFLLLEKEKSHLVKGNIYPVPDPRYPFLGVHFTPRMDGSVWLGPNAVLAFRREGYKYTDINLFELFDALRYPGFIKMALRNVRFGTGEMIKSIFPILQVRALRKFIPEIRWRDIKRGPAGVRAQAVDTRGNLVEDFVFDRGSGDSAVAKRVLHVRNAPSPGATSSLAIARMIADKIEKEFKLPGY